MPSPQPDFYRARAVEERDAASRSTEANVAGLHQEMAHMYDALAKELDRHFEAEAAAHAAK